MILPVKIQRAVFVSLIRRWKTMVPVPKIFTRSPVIIISLTFTPFLPLHSTPTFENRVVMLFTTCDDAPAANYHWALKLIAVYVLYFVHQIRVVLKLFMQTQIYLNNGFVLQNKLLYRNWLESFYSNKLASFEIEKIFCKFKFMQT